MDPLTMSAISAGLQAAPGILSELTGEKYQVQKIQAFYNRDNSYYASRVGKPSRAGFWDNQSKTKTEANVVSQEKTNYTPYIIGAVALFVVIYLIKK